MLGGLLIVPGQLYCAENNLNPKTRSEQSLALAYWLYSVKVKYQNNDVCCHQGTSQCLIRLEDIEVSLSSSIIPS